MTTLKIENWIMPALVTIVVIHLAVALFHGTAHKAVGVDLTAAQAAFVGIVIVLLPLVGSGLLWTKWRKQAAWIVALSMFASLVFGIVNHFVLASPDNVMSLPEHPWRHPFALSADLLAVTEAIGTVLGVAAVWQGRAGRGN